MSFAYDITNYHYILLPRSEEQLKRFRNPDNDTRGNWSAGDLSSKTKAKGHSYPIYSPTGKKFLPPRGRQWGTAKETFDNLITDNRIYFGKDNNGAPKIKQFLNEIQTGIVPMSVLLSSEVGSNTMAIRELMSMDIMFDTPKPISLIIHLLKITTKNGIVLNFFAGSGTTGHAVLELNKKDDGNRKFVLCTNNENNICTDVCYPRVKKVIKGYTDFKGNKVVGLGGGVKYFRTAFVDSAPTDANKKKIVDRSTEMLCLKEDCFDEVKTTKNYAIFRGSEKTLVIVYSDEGVEPARKAIAKMGKSCIVYVFSLDEYDKAEEFEDVKHLVKLKSIPVDILNLYRRLFG